MLEGSGSPGVEGVFILRLVYWEPASSFVHKQKQLPKKKILLPEKYTIFCYM